MHFGFKKPLFLDGNHYKKGGTLISIDGWKKQRVVMVLLNGIVGMLGTNACIIQTYFLTCASACAWWNHANGGGKRSKTIFENI